MISCNDIKTTPTVLLWQDHHTAAKGPCHTRRLPPKEHIKKKKKISQTTDPAERKPYFFYCCRPDDLRGCTGLGFSDPCSQITDSPSSQWPMGVCFCCCYRKGTLCRLFKTSHNCLVFLERLTRAQCSHLTAHLFITISAGNVGTFCYAGITLTFEY